MNFKQNKKPIDPRYFLNEQILGLGGFLSNILGMEPGDPADNIGEFVQGTPKAPPTNPNEVIARARSAIGKGWTYSLEGCPSCKGNAKDPKPDPKQVFFGASNATCDCSGFVSWSLGFWQKQWGPNGLSDVLGTPVSNPMPGDVVARGPMTNPKTNYPHFGIVSDITQGATDVSVNKGEADFTVIHCSSKNGPIEMKDAMKNGWAGNPAVPVMFYRPELKGADLSLSAPAQKVEQPSQSGVKPTNESSKKESKMKHNLWDRMMHRLLQEKKEKEVKASKSKGAKPDFLDLDKDGDKSEPMSKASKEAGGKKDTPKVKKGKGKIPPQLKMHIQKKKKNKLDEEIERLEKILFEELTDTVVQTGMNPLEEYGEDRYPDMEEEDDFDDEDFEDEELDLDDEGDEEFDDESFESEEMSDMDSDDYEAGDLMEEEIYSQEKQDELSYGDVGNDEESFYSFRKHGKKCNCDCHDEDEDFVKTDFEAEDLEESVEYLSEAEVKKKKPRLGKVTRNPSGSKKKFHVYVKCGGRVKKISFGDPGLSIKRDSASRRKNFRARHKCDKPAGKDRCTARYWSCYQWRAGKKVEGE